MAKRLLGVVGTFLALALTSLGLPQTAAAQPPSGWVTRLTDKVISQLQMDPWNNNIVYAAGSDANQNPYVYKTTDGGNTWTLSNKGLAQFTVYSMALATSNSGTLLLGGFNTVTRQAALYRTDDGAQTWTVVGTGDAGSRSIQALVFDPNSNQITLMGTDNGLFRTIDGGKTWTTVGAGGVGGANVHTLASEPAMCGILGRNAPPIYAGLDGETLGVNGGIFRTEDDGNGGIIVNNGLPPPKNAGPPNVATVSLLVTSPTQCGRIYGFVDSYQPQLWWMPQGDFTQRNPLTVNPVSLATSCPNPPCGNSSAWQQLLAMDRIYGIAPNPITNNQPFAQVFVTTATGLFVSQNDGRQFAYASEAGTKGPIQIGTTLPQRLYVGGQGVSAFDLSTGPIPVKLSTIQSPAPAPATPLPAVAKLPSGSGQTVNFPQTNHKVGGLWLDFFRANGDVDLFGLPRSDVIADPLSGQTVQYFQRVVVEYHPENQPPNLLQRRLLTDYVYPDPADPPIDPSASGAPQGVYSFFPNLPGKGLGHFVANQAPDGSLTYFKDYFDSHGREGIFGFPKEEPKLRVAADGQQRWTQRFQAAVMEAYPENDRDGNNPSGVPWRNYRVQLQLLGDMYIAKYNLGFK